MPGKNRKDVDLAAKIDFLCGAAAYGLPSGIVASRQTHMSWVFLVGDRVYKLKKPVRFSFLDYSSLPRREACCRAEVAINRRLAPGVYCGVVPLTRSADGLALDGIGDVVDWLVVMRRLDKAAMLDSALPAGLVGLTTLNRLGCFLADFYRTAQRIPLSPNTHLSRWRRSIAMNERALSAPGLALGTRTIALVHRTQRRFLVHFGNLVAARARDGHVVDGHGDLRPEHIHVGEPLAIIDRLEFSRDFRTVDPFDELAFLGVECDLLGYADIEHLITRHVAEALCDHPDPLLVRFYRSYRAAMRARLMVGHLAEPDREDPGGWIALARRYLSIAAREAIVLNRACDRCQRLPIRGGGEPVPGAALPSPLPSHGNGSAIRATRHVSTPRSA